MRHTARWMVGTWTFYEVVDHGFSHTDGPLYGFTVMPETWNNGAPKFGELYNTLEHAMVAAVGEKFTGPRGAGGPGVGTAADWFMAMIGAEQLQAVPDPSGVLADALMTAKGLTRLPHVLARSTVALLEKTGHVLARPAGR